MNVLLAADVAHVSCVMSTSCWLLGQRRDGLSAGTLALTGGQELWTSGERLRGRYDVVLCVCVSVGVM